MLRRRFLLFAAGLAALVLLTPASAQPRIPDEAGMVV